MSDTFVAARPSIDYIAERTGGEIVRDSLRIYREAFGPLLLIYSLPVLPVLALSAYGRLTADPVALLVVGILDFLVAVFPYGAVTIAVADICLGNRPTLASSYGGIARNFWRYIGTYAIYMVVAIAVILLGVAVGGFLFGAGHPLAGLGIGGVALAIALVWLCRYMFCCQICIIERRGPVQSLRRSRQLLRGSFWRVIGLSLAMLCLLWLVLLAVMVAWSAAMVSAPQVNVPLFNDVFARVLTIVGTPPLLVGFVLIYYDLRVRKENYDSEALTLDLMS